MQVSINAKGIMLIRSETELEAYALMKWLDDNRVKSGNLEFNTETTKEENK